LLQIENQQTDKPSCWDN